MLRMRKQTVKVREGIVCDRCGADLDEIEAQDALSFRDTGGPLAPWGDGEAVGVDLCPTCVVEVLRSWLKRDPDGPSRRPYAVR